ncbi:MAG TPA: cold shock domain-containing protein [Myxococcota bacterium]|nr:cold shock domain-containing protein [Myxococcota bacterium]
MEIHWDNVEEVDEALRHKLEARIRRLVAQHDDILSMRITGKGGHHHRHGAREIHIAAQAKGRVMTATRSAPDLARALHDAVDAFAHELRHVRGRRTSTRVRARAGGPPLLGLVDRLYRDGGYGFVLTDDGTSVYFHRNAVHGDLDFEKLEVGQRIALDVEDGDEGPQATVLRPARDVPLP